MRDWWRIELICEGERPLEGTVGEMLTALLGHDAAASVEGRLVRVSFTAQRSAAGVVLRAAAEHLASAGLPVRLYLINAEHPHAKTARLTA